MKSAQRLNPRYDYAPGVIDAGDDDEPWDEDWSFLTWAWLAAAIVSILALAGCLFFTIGALARYFGVL